MGPEQRSDTLVFWRGGWCGALLLDVPLSAVGDTLTLPITLKATRERKELAQETARRAEERYERELQRLDTVIWQVEPKKAGTAPPLPTND